MFGGPSGRIKIPNQANFSTVPATHMPRSAFDRSHTHKTTGQCGYVIPYFFDEILPGDTVKFDSTIFCRLLTPLVPAMDNLEIKTEYFFVPNRLVWTNWVKMMGEQASPGDSISYTVPQLQGIGGAGGSTYAVMSIVDYIAGANGKTFGGTAGYLNALPFRAISRIYNDWYRDENIMTPLVVDTGDGPDTTTTVALWQRAKKHDYFYGSLTQVQKGTAVSILSGTATVYGDGASNINVKGQSSAGTGVLRVPTNAADSNVQGHLAAGNWTANENLTFPNKASGSPIGGLYADLTTDTIDTINALRLAVTTQQFLEKDARAGTRYTELCLSHFGVANPDSRLQRSEYLGGGTSPVSTSPVPQTSPTGIAGTTTKLGDLAGITTGMGGGGHGFVKSFTEHGFVFGMVTIRVAALTYQQGMHRMLSRRSRYDYYWPVFANLGEQAVLNKEIYYQGDQAGANHDGDTWGYQERWAEYRYYPNRITGVFRSTASGTLDYWHYGQKYGSLPALNSTFLPDDSQTVVDRNLAVTSGATTPQFKLDIYNRYHHARVMPVRSVPGLTRL